MKETARSIIIITSRRCAGAGSAAPAFPRSSRGGAPARTDRRSHKGPGLCPPHTHAHQRFRIEVDFWSYPHRTSGLKIILQLATGLCSGWTLTAAVLLLTGVPRYLGFSAFQTCSPTSSVPLWICSRRAEVGKRQQPSSKSDVKAISGVSLRQLFIGDDSLQISQSGRGHSGRRQAAP
ncbi:hypothetical protein SKAU_G00314650 [Synaphobranchus kaupii]|uniref:Uncharacterized protein n=1 Tax=Synaphobranchus kaupii TaxID=118154 RepID=A0A9Q1ESB8_SYNKA|nr:hypothetical protein SKAU_G00314650 [Synaphobranchus kaupii]